jgi:flagellar protein FliO/FliZ
MGKDSEIWFAFARTFGMLFMVLALLLLAFYLIKRFSAARGGKGRDYIKVLSIHHLSPKEKLVLVNVFEETILIGVTPSNISKITSMEKPLDLPPISKSSVSKDMDSRFSDFLSRTVNRSSNKLNIKPSDKTAVNDD